LETECPFNAPADLWLPFGAGCRFAALYLLTHQVEDRLVPLKQTARYLLDPRTTHLVRIQEGRRSTFVDPGRDFRLANSRG
jgi:hypothetical protein